MVLFRAMWPNHESFQDSTIHNGSCFPAKESTGCLMCSFGLCSVKGKRRSLLKHFISKACVRLSASVVSPAFASIEEDEHCECSVELKFDLEADVSALPNDVQC